MRRRPTRNGSARLTILFVMVVIPPTIALVWLGVQLLEQDRALGVQRTAERRDAAIQSATLSLEQSLAAAQQWLVDDPWPEGTVRFTLSPGRIEAQPADRIAWLPKAPAIAAAATREFVEAEQAEFSNDAARALDAYTRLAASSSPAVRAGALLRVARVHRRGGAWDRALAAYRQLEAIEAVAIEEMPADLVARRAMGFVLEEAGRTGGLVQHAAAMEAELLRGRWRLDRVVWELTAQQLTKWTGRLVIAPPEARLLSAAAEALWDEWQQRPFSANAPARRVIISDGVPVTVLMRAGATGSMTAVAIVPRVIDDWLQRASGRAVDVTL
jgi:hypothetical protein